MSEMVASIVIPVFNKWSLTEDCLRSLKRTLPAEGVEVIVVDNASNDETLSSCPVLGQALFGDSFIYHRFETNLNFGPASNEGARTGTGRYVLFLNNDTIAQPGWFEPLLNDFTEYSDLAATGPVLMYPGNGPLGDTVQHLGVTISLGYDVGHLYEGIPAESSLVQERRFFQVITAACMLMPRELCLRHGGFDEGYINGFEDVDFCARLWAAGYRMTVNPASRMYHLASQSPGRHEHEAENFARLKKSTLHNFMPDWYLHAESDGCPLRVTQWGSTLPYIPPKGQAALAPFLATNDITALADLIKRNPFWYEGYKALAEKLMQSGDIQGSHAVLLSLSQLHPLPETLFVLLDSAYRMDDVQATDRSLELMRGYCSSFESRVQHVQVMGSWVDTMGLDALTAEFQQWLDTVDAFRETVFLPFFRRVQPIIATNRISSLCHWVYPVWRDLQDVPERQRLAEQRSPAPNCGIAFSLLMPVYNPEEEYLRSAVRSVLEQEWEHWELCLADDASADPSVRLLLTELSSLDSRIRVTFRERNGHIAAATNTALAMASHAYVALMDQDDILTPDALREMALAIENNPAGMLFYSDEDKMDDVEEFFSSYFKQDYWDQDMLLGQNFVNHLGVYRTERLRSLGGFRDGFPGAQDYDMLLRYTEGLDPACMVHVPKILYHWRAHQASTASHINVKTDVIDSNVRVLVEHLSRCGIDAVPEVLPASHYTRVVFALPAPPPPVSLIVDAGEDVVQATALIQSIIGTSGYAKTEYVLAFDETVDRLHKRQLEAWAPCQVKLLPLGAHFSSAARINAAVRVCSGKIIGVLGKGIVPLGRDWLEEIVSRLMQDGVGVLGGRLLDRSGNVVHTGHYVAAEGELFSLFRGLPRQAPGYFAWVQLPRTVVSVDPRCFFTRKSVFTEAGGLNDALEASAIDYCLRLGRVGLRTVTTPYAEFLCSGNADAPWENDGVVCEPGLTAIWQEKLSPCHPSLDRGHGDWTMHWNTVDLQK